MSGRLGPLVPSTARVGGALLALGSAQFIVAMVVVQLRYPGYSDLANYVSDLGGPASPAAWLFNSSIIALGLIGILGTVLARKGFPPKTFARMGILFLLVAEFSAILVGWFHETNNGDLQDRIHSLVSASTFIASALALVCLGIGMFRDTRWDGYRAYSFLSGLITFVAIGLFETDPLGAGYLGLWERLVIAPILLWALLAGSHLARLPAFAPVRPAA